MANAHLWIWTSDWHVVSTDVEAGGVGDTKPSDAAAVSAHIASLDPAGCIDTGDCKDHYGAGSDDELDQYIAQVAAALPWGTVNGGASAALPILPGNHDEVFDYADVGTVTDLSIWDAKRWPAPYHWTCDWPAAQVRYIAFHVTIIHKPTVGDGGFAITQAELDWIEDELDALPAGWQAITCSHAPVDTFFGSQVWSTAGGDSLRALMRANAAKIAAHLNGHRHANLAWHRLDGITHMNGPGMAYVAGDSRGGWTTIVHTPGDRSLTFEQRQGPAGTYPRTSPSPLVVPLVPRFAPPPAR